NNQQQEEEERKKKEEEISKQKKGIVKIRNISVHDLPKMDVLGKCDPFVVMKLGNDEKQTSVAKKSYNYDYVNEQFEFQFDPMSLKENRNIEIQVWDYDKIGFDEMIGSANIEILTSFVQEQQYEFFLIPKKGKKGKIQPISNSNDQSQEQDQGIGKVAFNLIYIPEMK
ncbi:MAG: hypothetical protein EZS28_025782, partial [Streblomastix strix]